MRHIIPQSSLAVFPPSHRTDHHPDGEKSIEDDKSPREFGFPFVVSPNTW